MLLAFFAIQIYFYCLPRRRDYEPELFMNLTLGYFACCVALGLGGFAQAIMGRRRDATVSFILALLAFLLGHAFGRYMAKA